tara:strand:+ start:462 stop:1271 length:810 start_codon:yes stop_codon:yes gene_type:complete
MQKKEFNIMRVIEETFEYSKDLSHSELETLKAYYFSYLKNGKYWLENNELNYKEIYQLIKELGNPKILDAGSGCGSESITFGILGAEVLGVEIKKDRLDIVNKRKRLFSKKYDKEINVKFELKNIFEVNGKFDIIWLNQAFHHMEPRKKIIEKLDSLLKINGYIIFGEANGWHPLVQAGLFKARGFKTIVNLELENGTTIPYGNERITTSKNIKKLFKEYKFTSISNRNYQPLPNNKKFSKISGFIEKLYLPSFAFSKYLLVLRKNTYN